MRKSDFQRDLAVGDSFWLGPITGSHIIDEYQFISYRERSFRGGPNHGEETGCICWSIYWKQRSIGRSARSLDSALAIVLSYKYLGPNSQAGELFMKMLAPETI